MIVDVALNPRIAQLLGRLEETRRLAQDQPEGHPAARAIEAKIEALYAEVGRYVHWLVRQDPEALERLAEEGRRWAAELGEQLRIELLPQLSSAELEFDELSEDESVERSATEMPHLDLTGDSRAGAVDVRDLVDVEVLEEVGEADALPEVAEVEELTQPTGPGAEAADVDDEPLIAVGDEESDVREGPHGIAVAVRTSGFDVPKDAERHEADAAARDDGDWLGRLKDLLEVLGPPSPAQDDAGRGSAVRSLAAATTNLEVRWAVFPDAVQQALLGLAGARARRLQEQDASEPDVRLALGRMRRFAKDRGLSLVPALREEAAVPRNWSADERRYWAVLHAGM